MFLIPNLDPVDEILALARRLKHDANLRIVDVCHENQLSEAHKILRNACQRGTWVIIKNCHFASHWSPEIMDIFYVS